MDVIYTKLETYFQICYIVNSAQLFLILSIFKAIDKPGNHTENTEPG